MTERTFNTPMMQQYIKIKEQYPESLLFYRLGDFYELFLEDAVIGARVLGITLTRRPRGKDGDIPMAGVPFHAVDQYLRKLVDAGYSIAVCEQVSDPSAKGIVEREVVRIVTPGTFVETRVTQDNVYIFALYIHTKGIGLSIADLSTGEFTAQSYRDLKLEEVISRETARYNPKECVVAEDVYNNPEYLHILNRYFQNISCYSDFETEKKSVEVQLKEKLNLISLHATGIDNQYEAQIAANALLGYLEYTQQSDISHFKRLTLLSDQEIMALDSSTLTNLEVFGTLRSGDKKGSLFGTIDRTVTAMGTRKLKALLRSPLNKQQAIEERFAAVTEFLENSEMRIDLRDCLSHIADIERLLARLSVKVGNPRDLKGIELSLKEIFKLKKILESTSGDLNQIIKHTLEIEELKKIYTNLSTNLSEEPPIDPRIGGIFKFGINSEIDACRQVIETGKTWLLDFEKKERERTGISTLKCGFNLVFGYYIEISKGQRAKAPADYMRKQTLVNAERFITPELKVQEEKILAAQEKSQKIEYEMYTKMVADVLTHSVVLQQTSECLGLLDCLLSFAQLAEEEHYVKPSFTDDGSMTLTQSRHPVVEKSLMYQQFVPNDAYLNQTDHQLLLLTGPNMAGKSVYMRQVALCVLLAQIGCFVPAEKAELALVDSIFVRSGASDSITTGLSTFMVEMVETAYILNHATKRSLIIMDEIGRGTSTYDGISIAWAVAEYIISSKLGAKTLFATHYHELQDLEEKYPGSKDAGGIKNYHVALDEGKQGPIFLHTVRRGGASHSFGIAVGKLAGLPSAVVESAKVILSDLESQATRSSGKPVEQKKYAQIIDRLKNTDIDRLQPIEALTLLAELQKKL